MKQIKIINKSKNQIIFNNGILSDNFFDRFQGLMGRSNINNDEALCIFPCNSIHTFFMKVNIDVVYIDRVDRICKIEKNIRPWKIGSIVKDGKYVIEMKSGMAEILELKIGDKIILENI